MDCSGSMYRCSWVVALQFDVFLAKLRFADIRFNSLDGRLNRMLEATCLILESMDGHADRFVSGLHLRVLLP